MAKVGTRKMGVRDAVRKRAKGRCEKCGEEFHRNRNKSDGTMHHRLPQRMGGLDAIENLLLLCLPCHRGLHCDENLAANSGWIAWIVPVLTPVLIRGQFWALLGRDGSYIFQQESPAKEQVAHLLTFGPIARRMRDPFMQELAA